MPINSSRLTITWHSLFRTIHVFNDIKRYFYDVITEFDSVPVTMSSSRRRNVPPCPLILSLGESQRLSRQITEETRFLPVPEIGTRFPPPLNVPPCHRLYTDCVTPAPIRFSVTCGGLNLILVELRALLSWFDNSCPWNKVSELYTHCVCICICSIKSGYSFPLPILSRVSQVFWKHFWLRIPSIVLKKFGTFSEIITKNLGHLKEKRDIFQKTDFPRRYCHAYSRKCFKTIA
jgi:hypothetical protein